MNAFEQNVYNYILAQRLVEPGMRLVLGVSGGADSVCLLRVLHGLKKPLGIPDDGLAVVHVHHGIRGAEADGDAAFTEQICRTLDIPCYLFREDVPALAKQGGVSIEEAGREIRYKRMEEIRSRLHYDRIAVAHNRDDMAETVLFHLIRGSGLRGLAGMAPRRGDIIRPLLGTSRAEIEAQLVCLQQSFREDSTNAELIYARNQIRNIILPAMREMNPRAVEHICETALEAGKSYAYICGQAMQAVQLHAAADGLELSIDSLHALDPALQEAVVTEAVAKAAAKRKDISRRHIRSVLALGNAETGSMVQLPYGICARRSYDKIILSGGKPETQDYSICISGTGDYEIPGMGIMAVTVIPMHECEEISKKTYTKYLDYDKIKGNLRIRTPQEGDFIVIDRKGNTKKLSRVFVDAKVDRVKRTGWPVLACGQEIIWVPGLRFSPAYYVTQDTNTVMKINYLDKGETHGNKD